MKIFYHAFLAGALLLPAIAQGAEPMQADFSGVRFRKASMSKAPARVTATELLADPEGTVLGGNYDEETCVFSGFKCSDQGRPGNFMKFYQAYHGCDKSINAVRVIGLFSYYVSGEGWLACDDRPGLDENYDMTKPIKFEVSFYRMDEDGMPGECVYKKEFELKGKYTGLLYGTAEKYPLLELRTELGEEVKLETGYMSFSAVNVGDEPSCWFNIFTADSSLDWAYVEAKDGSYNQSSPAVFSLLGTGAPAARKALKVSSIVSPLSAAMGAYEPVKVSLLNVGSEDYSGIKLQLWVDGKLVATEEPGFTIKSGQKRDYTFAHRVDCSAVGEREIRVVNVTAGDENISLASAKRLTQRMPEGEYCKSAARRLNESYGITSVKIGTIANESEPAQYSDFTAMSTDILPGQKLVLDLEPKSQNIAGVWIDWNNDGLFTGQSEMAGLLYDKTLEISIPDNIIVPAGPKRMRIVMNSNNDPDPCEDYYFGETEDYTLNVKRPEGSAAIAASLSKIDTSVDKNVKTVNLDLLNEGEATLEGTIEAEYVISPNYENRVITTENGNAPEGLKARKAAAAKGPQKDETAIHTLSYDKDMDNAVRFGNYETGMFAQYWPEEYMTSLKGLTINSIDVYFEDPSEKSAICIFNVDSEGKLTQIYKQDFVSAATSWNHVVLDKPVTINGEGLVYGVELKMKDECYHIGIDAHPADAGYGDLCNVGDNWWSMAALGMDHNLCIRANLGGERTAALSWLNVDKKSVTLASGAKETVEVKVDGSKMSTGVHEARLVVKSNDALTPLFAIPVYMVNGMLAGIETSTLSSTKVSVVDGKILINSADAIFGVNCYSMSGMQVKAEREADGYAIALDGFGSGVYAISISYADGHKESMKVAVGR